MDSVQSFSVLPNSEFAIFFHQHLSSKNVKIIKKFHTYLLKNRLLLTYNKILLNTFLYL